MDQDSTDDGEGFSLSIPKPALDDIDWARDFIAEWISIEPELEHAEFAECRAVGMSDCEIAHWWLEQIGMTFAARAPILTPPRLLNKDET